MMRSRFLLVVFALVLAGCDEDVYPFLETDRYFSVYGYLDTDAEVQYLRVVQHRRTVDPPPPGPLDATVTTEDIATGAVTVWRDSLVTFRDGTQGNVFYARFPVLAGHAYRLTVTDGAGNSSAATTVVPAEHDARVNTVMTGGVGSRFVLQEVRWDDVTFPPVRVQTWYRFADFAQKDALFFDVPVTYPESELGAAVRNEEGSPAWQVTIDYHRDADRIREILGTTVLPALYNVGMKISVTSADWRPPGGAFDPEVLIQPGTFSNVENGFGFFGSVAHFDAEWTLAPNVIRMIGYGMPDS